MNIKSYPLKRGQWFEEATEKQYVVWHGTAGRTLHTPSSGRPGRMRRPPPVKPAAHARRSTAGTSTPSASARRICVRRSGAPSASRDGTIYKTFDDTAWIYHLGIKGTNGRYDKSSVAIEFANELGLASTATVSTPSA